MFRRNGFDLFDDFFSDVLDDPFSRRETRESQVPQLMRTDVWEKDGTVSAGYRAARLLPGRSEGRA